MNDAYRPPITDELPLAFVDQRARLRALRYAMIAFVAADIAYAVVISLRFALVSIAPDLAYATATLMSAAPHAETLTFVAFGALLLTVLVGAHRNATVLASQPLAHSVVGLVAWFVVPIANLVVPFYAVRELWRASKTRSDAAPIPSSLTEWWQAWVGTWMFAAAWRFAIFFEKEALAAAVLAWVATFASAYAAVKAVAFVRALDELQRRSFVDERAKRGAHRPEDAGGGGEVENQQHETSGGR